MAYMSGLLGSIGRDRIQRKEKLRATLHRQSGMDRGRIGTRVIVSVPRKESVAAAALEFQAQAGSSRPGEVGG